MLYSEKATPETEGQVLAEEQIRSLLYTALDKLGPKRKVLAIPPDITRMHSQAGLLTRMVWEYYGDSLTDILPALGTHTAMTEEERQEMFGDIPASLFRVHRWRKDVVTLGEVPESYIEHVSEGKLSFSWPAQVNKLLVEGGFDLIVSIGQVVPHEVIGMANYNKNIFVGTGGSEGIHKSHYLGAVYGMERIMGRADNPVRSVIDYAHEKFAGDLPLVFVQTVIGHGESGELGVKGLFIGDERSCFTEAAALSAKVNITKVPEPLKKVVVYLDPKEYRSTWLGNKAIYRTRMAIADGGELIVLAPGVKEFGEDREIDELIRKFGYAGTDAVTAAVEQDSQLRNNLSAAAHLIHGSSEGRFHVTYCPGGLSREETEKAGFSFADVHDMMKRYDPAVLHEGMNTLQDGEEIFFIQNPAVGLWAHPDRMKGE